MKVPSKPLSITVCQDLILTEAQVADAAPLYQLIENGRLYLREWLPFVDFSRTVADTELYLRTVSAPGNMQDKVYAIRYRQQVAGIIGYKTIDRVNSKLEIGYWLGEEFQGKAIMVRSCEALIRHAFEHMRMNRIQIKAGVGNRKSSRIPQRLGFKLEGIERDGEWLRGRFIDLEVYSMLKKEWKLKYTSSDPGENGQS